MVTSLVLALKRLKEESREFPDKTDYVESYLSRVEAAL